MPISHYDLYDISLIGLLYFCFIFCLMYQLRSDNCFYTNSLNANANANARSHGRYDNIHEFEKLKKWS